MKSVLLDNYYKVNEDNLLSMDNEANILELYR